MMNNLLNNKEIKLGILLILLNVYLVIDAFGQVPLVFDVENRTVSGCNITPGNTSTSNTYLPDPFSLTNGGRVQSFDDWTCRRNQIKSDIEQYEIGPKPPKPANVTATYTGGRLTVTVVENGQTLTLTSNVTMPSSGTGPFPVVIGMNAPTGQLSASLFSGVIQIPFNHDQVVSYGAGSGTINPGDPYFKLYPSTNIGKYSAWSWGISRLIDGIEIVKSQMNADPRRIAVTGCSYAGKMALFAGAFDERVALTIAQESGGGGINAWRTSQAFTTRTGTNIEKIDNTNYSWFKSSMRTLNPNTLPHDHHELIAMIAPRAFLTLGNPGQVWLGDESGYKSCMAALEVWKAMGVEDRFGFDFTGGHNHCVAASTQNNSVTAFVNKFLKNNTTANTNIRINPSQSGFNLTMTSVINWTTPYITASDPDAPKPTLTAPLAGTLEAPASLQLAASVTDANSNVSKVEFYNGTSKLGEDASAPYTLALTDLAAGTYTFSAKATDATNKTGTSATVTVIVKGPPFKIQRTTAAPTIDGVVEELWSSGTEAVLGTVLSGTVTNAGDLSGTFKAMWDNTYLYILANVNDQTLNNDSQNAYDDDGVEVYLDINNDKATTYGANDVQYTFGWNNGTTVGTLPSGRPTTNITYQAVAKEGGYVVEARIPWTTLTGTPAIDQLLGIEFMINDDDNGTARDKKLSWTAATDDAWQNPSLFGVAKLAAETVTASDNSTAISHTSGIYCYPNPFNSSLTVETKGDFSYLLINQLGQVLMRGAARDQIVLDKELSKGVYLLKVTKGDESSILKLVRE